MWKTLCSETLSKTATSKQYAKIFASNVQNEKPRVYSHQPWRWDTRRLTVDLWPFLVQLLVLGCGQETYVYASSGEPCWDEHPCHVMPWLLYQGCGWCDVLWSNIGSVQKSNVWHAIPFLLFHRTLRAGRGNRSTSSTQQRLLPVLKKIPNRFSRCRNFFYGDGKIIQGFQSQAERKSRAESSSHGVSTNYKFSTNVRLLIQSSYPCL